MDKTVRAWSKYIRGGQMDTHSASKVSFWRSPGPLWERKFAIVVPCENISISNVLAPFRSLGPLQFVSRNACLTRFAAQACFFKLFAAPGPYRCRQGRARVIRTAPNWCPAATKIHLKFDPVAPRGARCHPDRLGGTPPDKKDACKTQSHVTKQKRLFFCLCRVRWDCVSQFAMSFLQRLEQCKIT